MAELRMLCRWCSRSKRAGYRIGLGVSVRMCESLSRRVCASSGLDGLGKGE
jgi:hypothetical protein